MYCYIGDNYNITTCLKYLPPGNTLTKEEGVSMDSKLIQDVRLELQLNRLLKQIDYQLDYPNGCNKKCGSRCKQCLYNVGTITPICSKSE